jgi:transcriptional regulator with GAF, ATPase, and Fis domain
MVRFLFAWIGMTDLKAGAGDPAVGAGPIAQAVSVRQYDQIVLLNNYAKAEGASFRDWLAKRTAANVVVRQETLRSPTDYTEIYRAASSSVSWALETLGKKAKLTFHLSPGTPAMASIWIIIAKTRFEAELIESSKEKGVVAVDVPFDLAAEFIPSAVKRANDDLERLSAGLRPEEPKFGDILHRSDAMTRLVRRGRQAAAFSAPVLIEGETGTGKELLAAAIHKESPRGSKPLVVVNCGAVPKELIESEFFGHTKGAFTGAVGDRAGYFEQANGGTLFLDEVGELSLDAQAKLLRVLQDKKVRRVGGKTEVAVDVRIIAATNRDLLIEVRADRFREDLFFRLAVLVLKTPPLRQREGDIGLLLQFFVDKINNELTTRPGTVQKKLSARAKNVLLQHPWPGNVRELEATLLRAFVWSNGPIIDEVEARDALVATPRAGQATTEILGRGLGNGFSLTDTLADVARHYLARAVAEAGGNKTKAASLVGFANYQTLKNWLEKYEVDA